MSMDLIQMASAFIQLLADVLIGISADMKYVQGHREREGVSS